ncbi:MAG: energy transducer TonB [Burkholderiales bacterium]|nr:energy transducer TonB [Burkholderiales bacterium]
MPGARRIACLMAFAVAALLPAVAGGADRASIFTGLPFAIGAPVTHQPPLPYPVEAERRGREGTVVVAFLVGEDGVPERYRIIESDPPLLFDAVVNAAAPEFRFAPAVRNGKPARYETHITLNFRPPRREGAK